MFAVIMAGGQGTRLWPLSRKNGPKQLHRLLGDKSMIQQTFERLSLFIPAKNILVSTTPDYLNEIKKHLTKLPAENYIVEPYPMGTAAAYGLISNVLNLRDRNATVFFVPADYMIKDNKRFAETLLFAGKTCDENPKKVITIGIKPTKPDTNLGYIQLDQKVSHGDGLDVFEIKRFVEKPDLQKAEEYLLSGDYLWNAGIFVSKAAQMLELIKKNLPETDQVLSRIMESFDQDDFTQKLSNGYNEVDNTSIDYGVMEKNKEILVIPGDFGWHDIGSWGTMLEVLSEVEGSNVVSRGNHISVGDSNVLVMGSDKLIATVGLKDIVIVDSADALLVCDGKVAHKVKDVIDKLKEQNKNEYL